MKNEKEIIKDSLLSDLQARLICGPKQEALLYSRRTFALMGDIQFRQTPPKNNNHPK